MHYSTIVGYNIRVYAICIKEQHLMVLKEPFAGKMVNKLPGGGLEYGEGTVDCLIREFKEELSLEIQNITPFYIQEHFVPSLAKDNKQILMLYFLVDIKNLSSLKILDNNIKEVLWTPIDGENILTLPVDQIVFEKLKEKFC